MNATIFCPAKLSPTAVLILQLLLFYAFQGKAQCNLEDRAFTICDLKDEENKKIDLNSFIVGVQEKGIWSDDDNSGALDSTTGILNAQLIKKGGIYHFTYFITDIKTSRCTNSKATITATIGGYPGSPYPNAILCNLSSTYDLFPFLSAKYFPAHKGGKWSSRENLKNFNKESGILNTNEIILSKTYVFTYRVEQVGSCPEASSTLKVTFYEPPNSGLAQNLNLCSNELNKFSKFDLNSLLENEDHDGTWLEKGKNPLNSKFVNLQKLYSAKGEGKYTYTYKVISDNLVCEDRQSTVKIEIVKFLDLTGATLQVKPDLCMAEITPKVFEATLKAGTQKIPDGEYQLTYTIGGKENSINTISSFSKGIMNFPIPISYFKEPKDYTISIQNLAPVKKPLICNNIKTPIEAVLHIYPNPTLLNAHLKSEIDCQSGQLKVNLYASTNLNDGDYNIAYDLSSSSNTIKGKNAKLNFSSAYAAFFIPKATFPKSENYTLTITQISNAKTGCKAPVNLSTILSSRLIAKSPQIKTSINDGCTNLMPSATISGLEDIGALNLTYKLAGANPMNPKSLNLVANDGKIRIDLPALSHPGLTVFNIISLKSLETNCDLSANSKTTFTVNASPTNPKTEEKQSFCAENKPIVAMLAPQGIQYLWYNDQNASSNLNSERTLSSKKYYVQQISKEGCRSDRVVTEVVVNEIKPPVSSKKVNEFCLDKKPTIESLSGTVANNSNLLWFDSPSRENMLANTFELKENSNYYGFNFDPLSKCYSSPLETMIKFTSCAQGDHNLKIPNGFSPNGDGVNDTFEIKNIGLYFPNYTMEIFDRYGNCIFKGGESWDGSEYASKIAATGIYYYIINFNKDNIPTKKGQLFLNR